MIRIANRRFLEALGGAGAPCDVETQLAALRAVNLSAYAITRLLRAQALMSAADPDDDGLADLVARLESPLLFPPKPGPESTPSHAAVQDAGRDESPSRS